MNEPHEQVWAACLSEQDRQALLAAMSLLSLQGYTDSASAIRRLLSACTPTSLDFNARDAWAANPYVWRIGILRSGYGHQMQLDKKLLDSVSEPAMVIGHEVMRTMLKINIALERQPAVAKKAGESD